MDLQQLIASAKGQRSYQALSLLTIGVDPDRPGEPVVSPARFGQLGIDALQQAPNPLTIRGVAVALDVTERAVWLAVAESLGLSVGQFEIADLMPPAAASLPREAFTPLRGLVQEMVRLYRATPAPGATARSA